jgi:hypothetical protein
VAGPSGIDPDAVEIRVLGCLLERQRAAPEAFVTVRPSDSRPSSAWVPGSISIKPGSGNEHTERLLAEIVVTGRPLSLAELIRSHYPTDDEVPDEP